MNEVERFISVAARGALETNIRSLDPKILRRLEDARRNVLARHQGHTVTGLTLEGRFGILGSESLLPFVRSTAAIAALVLGIIGSYCWTSYDDADQYAEIDSAILADDLPVDAYSDPGFHVWLDTSSQP